MLSIAITSYNRSDLTIESFSKVWDHPLIDEIVIVDDASEESHWNRLLELIDAHPASQKINVFRNEKNLGMSRNKAEAISKAKNKWCILFDSDNILYPEYLDAAVYNEQGLNHINMFPTTIYMPVNCEAEYSFEQFADFVIDKRNAKDFLHIKEFRIFLNQSNYLVNREKYLEVYKYNPEIKESDTIWMAYLWLKAGYSFYFVPGMRYMHRKHSGSGWLNGDHSYNLKKAAELQEKIKNL